MIDHEASLVFAPGISVGAFAGGALSRSFNSTVLLWVFVVFLLSVGARMLYSYWEKEKVEHNSPVHLSTGMYVLIAVFGLVVGFLAGLTGGWRRHFHRSIHGLCL